jgi:uncharacterized repeat protein (TIGR02543 family)
MLSMALLCIVFIASCKKDTFQGEVVGVCPTVTTDPMDKAIDVALNKVITITFNTSMAASTITNTSFTITPAGGVAIAGVISPTTNNAVFTFTPTLPLQPNVLYTGTITTAVTDTLRTALVANDVWTFTSIPLLTVSSNPVAGGTSIGGGTFAKGASVAVTATPNAGYTFTNWTENGVAVSTSASYPFTLTGNRTLVANFAVIPTGNFAVNLSSSPAAGGSTAGSGSFPTGSTVVVTSTPATGYTFVNWTDNGVIVSTSPSYQFVIAANRTLVANFKIIPTSQFAVVLSSNPPAGGTTTGSGAYASGTSVTVSAFANPNYVFTNWTDAGVIVSTSPAYTFVLAGNRTLVANFVNITYTLNVVAVNGGVVISPNQATYISGSTVQLSATPNSGYNFTGWSGDASGTINPLTVTMNANKNIVANFAPIPVLPPLFASIFGAFGGNAGITNQGLFTVINNGSIGTTAASTLVTGFHDITGDKYTETPLNVGNISTGRIYTYAPPPVIFGPGGPFGGNAATKVIADQGLAAATAFYISISPANKPGGTDPGAGELGGLTLAPGVYQAAGGTFKITNLDLVLDAKGDPNATWIFQTASSLTVGTPAAPRSVKLIGGALAQNVYWYVGSTAVINYAGGAVMTGTIIANSGVTLSSPANSTNALVQTVLNGRAISLVSSVTMVNTVINIQ